MPEKHKFCNSSSAFLAPEPASLMVLFKYQNQQTNESKPKNLRRELNKKEHKLNRKRTYILGLDYNSYSLCLKPTRDEHQQKNCYDKSSGLAQRIQN